jgi:hypothetical protein
LGPPGRGSGLGSHGRFAGVYAKDELEHRLKRGGTDTSFIFNSDDSTEDGTRWGPGVFKRTQTSSRTRAKVDVRLFDPMAHARLMNSVVAHLKKKRFKKTTLEALSWQKTGWDCGYWSSFATWHGAHTIRDGAVADFKMPKKPHAYNEVVWEILKSRAVGHYFSASPQQRAGLLRGEEGTELAIAIVNECEWMEDQDAKIAEQREWEELENREATKRAHEESRKVVNAALSQVKQSASRKASGKEQNRRVRSSF